MRIQVLILMMAVCLPSAGASQGAAGAPQLPKTHASTAPEARVDINHASADELLSVQGMTRTWAERIVRFRPYRTKQDLLDRGVLPSEVYERIKDGVIAHREKQ